MKRVLITGAGDGIGRALAEHYVVHGNDVIGLDIDARGASFRCDACDLADGEAVAAAVAGLAAEAPFDIVVHNAGINETARFERGTPTGDARMLAVNLTAPMLLTAGLLRHDAVAAGGTVVFVASLSHQVGYPGAAVYAATKDGLTSYARSLFVELGPQSINVLTVFPGPTRTAQARAASPEGSDESKRMPPQVLAAGIARAVRRGRRVFVPGLGNKAFAFLGRCLPRMTERGMRKAIYDKLA